jgi:nucleotide-binding universal stress UspA family protein
MKKILVPCDFSRPAVNAYRFALKVAEKSKGVINLIHVIELPILHDTMLMPVLSIEKSFMDDMKIKTERNFKKLIEKYETKRVKVKSTVVFGAVSRMIADYATAKSMDVIVMGSHGASGIREFFIGSNAEKIVRTSRVPVFVLKDFYNHPIERIIFPYSHETDELKDLVKEVINLQRFFKAHMEVVWINTPGIFYPDIYILKRMKEFARRYKLRDFTIHVFNDLNERDGIINFTDHINGDLIVMGTHGRKGIAHLLSGSTAEKVVNHVKWPIWTYVIK